MTSKKTAKHKEEAPPEVAAVIPATTEPTQELAVPVEPFHLTRLELARKLPVVSADAHVFPGVPLARGSIEAFRTADGKTMLVVAVVGADGKVSLAAQEMTGETA